MYRVNARPNRLLVGFYPTFFRRPNLTLLIPFRFFAMALHLTSLICVADAIDAIVQKSLLSLDYVEGYVSLRHSADACLAFSFFCLLFNFWGIGTARTLRSGLMSALHGCFHFAAAILLIVVWRWAAHVWLLWYVFYIFSIIPTGLEIIALGESYFRGLDSFF